MIRYYPLKIEEKIKGNLNRPTENHIELTQKLLSKNESGIFQESEKEVPCH